MESKRQQIENEWLALLENAIKDGVKIQVNHRFKYQNKNLGTFLVSTKRNNKTELMKRIEDLGFDYKMHSLNPKDYVDKFIIELSKEEKPNRQSYTTRFNKHVLPKKRLIEQSTIDKVNAVWEDKFGNVRKWKKPENDLDKIKRWKKFRYDEKKNPNGTWFATKKNIGKLYSWIYTRRNDVEKMNVIWKYFNEQEKKELVLEGFKEIKEEGQQSLF